MPERDMLSLGMMGLGGWTWPKKSPAAVAVVVVAAVAVRRRRWIGCATGLAAPLDWLRRWIVSVTLASYCMPTGRAMEGTGRAMEGMGRAMEGTGRAMEGMGRAMERTCKSMLGL